MNPPASRRRKPNNKQTALRRSVRGRFFAPSYIDTKFPEVYNEKKEIEQVKYMLKNDKAIIAGFLAGSCLLTMGGLYLYTHKDMTGVPYSEIIAYQEHHPYKNITYTVTIDGGDEPLELNQSTRSVTLTDGAQALNLAENADYLQKVTDIRFDAEPTAQQLAAVIDAFPSAAVEFASVSIGGNSYACDSTVVDLSGYTSDQLEEVTQLLGVLPALETVKLTDASGSSGMTLDDVLALHEAHPTLFFDYTFELFGQQVSTDMETLEYFQADIGGDAGLDVFRQIIGIMPNLTYLKLDSCGTTDEATAQLREDLSDQCKVVWRVFFGQNNALTDTYKIWATWNIDTKEVACLQYCNEVKYLDLGHNSFMNLDFMSEMKDLEMAIVAIGNLHDISGIANCTKLEFLEIFSNRQLTDEDMQNLSDLTNMKYLNISNTILMRDLSFTDNMTNLRKLWCTISRVPWAETERVKALHPDCEFVFLYDGDPTDYGWRYTRESGYTEMTPEYALVRARFGYDTWDFSRDEKGYLREEITYESLGLTPS